MRSLEQIKEAQFGELTDLEKSAVVYKFCMGAEVELDADGEFYYSLHGNRRVIREVDANLLRSAEDSMYAHDFIDQYAERMANKASASAYAGLSAEEQSSPSTAMKFYRVLGTINLEHSLQVIHDMYKTK